METRRWVQHISGQGKIFEVSSFKCADENEWPVKNTISATGHFLPKSEYVPCEPPEQWKKVFELVTMQPSLYVDTVFMAENIRVKRGAGRLIVELKVSR